MIWQQGMVCDSPQGGESGDVGLDLVNIAPS